MEEKMYINFADVLTLASEYFTGVLVIKTYYNSEIEEIGNENIEGKKYVVNILGELSWHKTNDKPFILRFQENYNEEVFFIELSEYPVYFLKELASRFQ